MPLLFSYGTLQQENTQQLLLQRILKGTPDTLKGYKLEKLYTANALELTNNQQNFYWRAEISDNKNDTINGMLYNVTKQELQQMDTYEGNQYRRIKTTFVSGKQGWVYSK